MRSGTAKASSDRGAGANREKARQRILCSFHKVNKSKIKQNSIEQKENSTNQQCRHTSYVGNVSGQSKQSYRKIVQR